MATTTDYADILSTVVENGRLNEDWDHDELEVEIDHEARVERGLSDEEVAEAIEYAQQHIRR